MSDTQNLFSSNSVQTFIAAAFILALMATGIATYNTARSGQVESAVLDLRIEQTRLMEAERHYRAQSSALEGRIQALEAQQAAATPSATE
jgi:hypothetical protein